VRFAAHRTGSYRVRSVYRPLAAIAFAIRFAHPEVSDSDAQRFAMSLQQAAQQHEFDPLTGVAIIHHESRFRPHAVSRDKEDYGLAQIRARYIGECRKDRDPLRRPSPACVLEKQRLLDPNANIRRMAELIAYHRGLCRRKVGSADTSRWLASYQGRNDVRNQRWCVPAKGTYNVLAYRQRLLRELIKAGHLEPTEASSPARAGPRKPSAARPRSHGKRAAIEAPPS
jgi:hypothetical protein